MIVLCYFRGQAYSLEGGQGHEHKWQHHPPEFPICVILHFKIHVIGMFVIAFAELVFDSQMSRANLSASLGLTMQEVKNGPPFPRDKSFMILLKQEIESKVLKPGIIYTEITLKRTLDMINQISVPHVSHPDLLVRNQTFLVYAYNYRIAFVTAP